MKPNDDFSQAARQSNAAIIIIIFNLYRNWIKRLLPILLALFVSSGKATLLVTTFGIFIVLVALFGIIYFFKYTYYIADNELIIEKGVFKRSKMVIPFERIQSINFKQAILHQIFSVVELEIDTAGSSKIEFDLRAISKQKAEALRQIILNSKPEKSSLPLEETTSPPAPTPKILFKLSFGDLMKVGLTENHLRSGLVPIAMYFWLRDLLRNGGINLDDLATKYADPEKLYQLGLIILGILFLGYALIAILISMIRSVLRFFDLTFYRTEEGFMVTYGLFTKRQISIQDPKIQIFKWQDNLLRKIPKIFNMQIKQAASAEVKKKTSSIHLAGLSERHIHQFLDAYYDKDYAIDDFIGISKWWFIRRLVIYTVLVIGSLILYQYFPEHPAFGISAFFFVTLILTSYLYFRKKKFGVNDEVIHIKGGRFGDSHQLIQLFKIQGVSLKQSPFQRRKDLAGIVIFTAAGNINLPYLAYDVAEKLRDYILQIVETDGRAWM
ncbi:MAG TPA: hypothetical protein ENK85_04505 [Saprospiraceae bacterium]|nr:hypothetical protein [Saprospiraceae bacterium]